MTELARPDHNPKAPWRTVDVGAVESDRDSFLARLAQLGAADDVVESVRVNWDDPEWIERDQVVALPDDALRAELAAIEREYHEGTHTEEDDAAAELVAFDAAASEILGENVAVVVAWVHDDQQPPKRAQTIEALESQRAKPRTTLLDACAAVITAAEHGE